MTVRAVYDNLKEAVHAPETDKVFITLITFSHPDLTDDIRVCDEPLEDFGNEVYGVTSRGEQYIFLDFEITLPDEDEEFIQFVKLRMDNTNRDIIASLRSVSTPPAAIVETVLHDDPETIEISIKRLKLKTAPYDASTITANLSTEHSDAEAFPKNRFSPSNFKGMFDGVG